MSKNILILGAGSWGTALALQLSYNNHYITLWSRNEQDITNMKVYKKNIKYLPNITLPSNINVTSKLNQDIINNNEYILICTPSYTFKNICQKIKNYSKKKLKIISATKGLCHESHQLLNHIAEKEIPNIEFAFLAGPSFAEEVANKLPTAVVIASKNMIYSKEIQYLFSNNHFRCYRSNDIIGSQIGGVCKNIFAISSGIISSIGYQTNSLSALITRGIKEISELGIALGGKEKTLYGLSGLGDLILTSSDSKSRNKRFGSLIGKGYSIEESKKIIDQTIEGIETTKIIYLLSQKYKIQMPIVESTYNILFQKHCINTEINNLMSRSLKEE